MHLTPLVSTTGSIGTLNKQTLFILSIEQWKVELHYPVRYPVYAEFQPKETYLGNCFLRLCKLLGAEGIL